MKNTGHTFMREAIRLSIEAVQSGKGQGPFGAVVVKDGKIIAGSCNRVVETNDPTAHAEVMAIREAAKVLGTFNLEGCELYTSCEPCPMCLGAVYWSRVSRLYYANTQADAAAIGFDDQFIYEEIDRQLEQRRLPSEQMLREEALIAFQQWAAHPDKQEY
jgi:tRNA(Arg) A34 adenosine deaminase TadA